MHFAFLFDFFCLFGFVFFLNISSVKHSRGNSKHANSTETLEHQDMWTFRQAVETVETEQDCMLLPTAGNNRDNTRA